MNGEIPRKEVVSQLMSYLEQESIAGIPKKEDEKEGKEEKTILKEVKVKSSALASNPIAEMNWEELEKTALGCTKCRLCSGRTNVVFGVGKKESPLIAFVGEGPGAEEDKKGEPFVGRAGMLLTSAITGGMGLAREDVYIANVVKCRPPENRAPLPDETDACTPYLYRQLELLQPKVIITLGQPAQKALSGVDLGITKLRGQWQEWRGIKLMPTFHPAYLLRNPPAKKPFWEDLQAVMKELSLPLPTKKSFA